MKSLMSVLLGLSLMVPAVSFAQAGGGTTGSADKQADSGKKAHKDAKKGHKGGKKSKKGSSTTTPPPK